MSCATAPYNACFFGGSCAENATVAALLSVPVGSCACPPAWVPDNFLFFQSSCSVPDVAYAVTFALVTAAYVPSLVALALELYRRRSKRTLVRDIGAVALVVVTMVWLAALCNYVERGMFYATSVFYGLITASSGVWLRLVANLMVKSMTGVFHIPGLRVGAVSVDFAAAALVLVGLATAAALSATSGAPPAVRNLATCVLYFMAAVSLFVATLLMRRHITMLIDMITTSHASLAKASTNSINMGDLIDKLKAFRTTFSMLLANMVFVISLIPIVFLSLGSFPFIWLVIAGNYVALVGAIARSTVVLLRSSNNASSSSSNSKDDAAVAPESPRVESVGMSSPGSPGSLEQSPLSVKTSKALAFASPSLVLDGGSAQV